jgi:UDP-N-acetylmuramoyl-L-alanyl-D-glutamate--2,6-diaminopimelate ligase
MGLNPVIALPQLFLEIPIAVPIPSLHVKGIIHDSRQVNPGDLFVALEGGNVDGHQFISHAVEQGAVAVVGTKPVDDVGVPYIRVEDGRAVLAMLSAAFYGYPARKLTMIGVTGTDGKTTTVNLLYHILMASGVKAGMITTVNAVIGNQTLDTGYHVTTPEAPDVQRYLAQMVDCGITHAVLEVTSHGLAQKRVGSCDFDVGVITNITHEHLDYHGSFDAYRAAKAGLFLSLDEIHNKKTGSRRVAVLNRDDESFFYLENLVTSSQVTYGLANEADVRAEDVRQSTRGLLFNTIGPGFKLPVACNLLGKFNVSNCLAALTTGVVGLGLDPTKATRGIENLKGIPGRMEIVEVGQDFTAIVDFAHTPNALKRTLETGRTLTSGQLLAVFGSAGLRDVAKRRMMAGISVQIADVTVLTAEDPRTEPLDEILTDMADGAKDKGGEEGRAFYKVPDRRDAIRFAISMARPGDVVMILGKGHEQSMCFREVEYAWDDRTATKAAISNLLGIIGPEMPWIPSIG